MPPWGVGYADVLNNLANSLGPVQRLITVIAYIIGLAFWFKAVYTLKVYGEARTMMSSNTSIKEPLLYMIVGSALVYFPTMLEILLQTSFGYSNILEYAPVTIHNGAAPWILGKPLAMVIQTVGLVAFVRGWVLIARSASQGQPAGGTGKGLMHVFGGILAMNIIGTMTLVNNTLYGG